TLGGSVVNDANGNGSADVADTPLAGVPVTVQPAAGGVAATTFTTANGTYSFPSLAANSYTVSVGAVAGLLNGNPASATLNLTAGSYLVVEHDPSGAVSTGANAGLSGTATVVDPNNIQVTLNGAQSAIGLRYLDRTPQATGISGFVYNDTNNNNAIDPPADQPVPNATVELRDAAQNLLASMFTDQTGAYFFGSVASGGTYVIRVLPPSGFLLRKASPSAPATLTGNSAILIQGFNPSANYANNNFLLGPVPPVSPVGPGTGNAISGKVFNDLNADRTV